MLGRVVNKLQDMYSYIDKDIDFDESVEPDFIPCVQNIDDVKEVCQPTDDKNNNDNIVNDFDKYSISIGIEKDNFLSNNKKRKRRRNNKKYVTYILL